MTGKTWCLPRQTRFFMDRKPEFIKHQTAGDLQTQFWPTIRSEFFAIWPNQDSERKEWEEEDKLRRAMPSKKKKKKKSTTEGEEDEQEKRETRKTFNNHDAWYKARSEVGLTRAIVLGTRLMDDHSKYTTGTTTPLHPLDAENPRSRSISTNPSKGNSPSSKSTPRCISRHA